MNMFYFDDLKKIFIEFVKRFFEIFVLGALLSLGLHLIGISGFLNNKIFIGLQFVFLIIFQILNYITCNKSYRRVKYDVFRYYPANIIAYFFYIVVSTVAYIFVDAKYFSFVFSLNKSLVLLQEASYETTFLFILAFHFVSLFVMLFSLRIRRTIRNIKEQPNYNEENLIIE